MSSYNGSTYQTPYPTVGRRYSNVYNDKAVGYDHELLLSDVLFYLKEENLENTELANCIVEYKKGQVDIDNTPFSKFIQHVSDTKILVSNKELYADILQLIEHTVSNNQMHKNIGEEYRKYLSRVFFQDNANSVDSDDIKKYSEPDYSTYEFNNFRKRFTNDAINNLASRGGTLYLNSNGKICCRLSIGSDMKVYSKIAIETVLSSYLGYPIKITDEVPRYDDIDTETVLRSKAIEGVIIDEK